MRRLPRYLRFVVLVGLLSASVAPGARAKPRAGDSIAWGLTACDAVIALIPVDADSVQAHLPKGFTAEVPDSVRALLPPDPRLEAVFGLEGLACEEGVGLKRDVDGMQYGSYWTFVEPPKRLADDAYPLRFFKWDTLVPDRPRRNFLAARGLPVSDGDTTFTSWNPTPVGIAFDVTLRLGGSTHRFLGSAGSPVDFSGTFVEFTKARRGLSAWRTAYDSTRAVGGTGIVEMQAESFPAEVVGSERAQSYFLVGSGVNFTDASITFLR